jgi:hypothetical protein
MMGLGNQLPDIGENRGLGVNSPIFESWMAKPHNLFFFYQINVLGGLTIGSYKVCTANFKVFVNKI